MTTPPPVRRTVLLVEDEATLREPLRRYLERTGFAVIEADSVDAAAALLPQIAIAAAILDVRMPQGRSGLDVLEHMRRDERWRSLPVIILTGARLSEREEEIIRRDRAYVFYKPHGYQAIAEQLHRAVEGTS